MGYGDSRSRSRSLAKSDENGRSDASVSPRKSFRKHRSRSPQTLSLGRRPNQSRSPSPPRTYERYRRRHSRSRSRDRRRSRSYSPPPPPRRYPRRSRSGTPSEGARLHIADLDADVRKRDLEKVFENYGEMREIWMARNPPCFAFICYEHQKDAERALRAADGIVMGHSRIKVTMARPRVRGGRFRGYDPSLKCYQCGEVGHFSRNCRDNKYGYKRENTPNRFGYGGGGGSRGHHSRYRSRSRSRGRRSRS